VRPQRGVGVGGYRGGHPGRGGEHLAAERLQVDGLSGDAFL